jgi:hypothetical protein
MSYRKSRRLLIGIALLSALSLSPELARAQSSAAEHAKKGQVAFDLQDFAGATTEFESAYKIEQKPEYLWSLAQAQRLGGKCTEAIRSYRAFQRAEVSANQANAAEMMVTKCEAELAKEEARQTSTSRGAGEQTPAAPPSSESPEKDTGKSSGGLGIGWFIGAATITVAVGAVATYSALDTGKKSSAYEETPTRERYLEGKDAEKRTNLLLGITAAAAVGTAVIAVFTDWGGSKESAAKRGVRVSPAIADKGGAFVLTGNF